MPGVMAVWLEMFKSADRRGDAGEPNSSVREAEEDRGRQREIKRQRIEIGRCTHRQRRSHCCFLLECLGGNSGLRERERHNAL